MVIALYNLIQVRNFNKKYKFLYECLIIYVIFFSILYRWITISCIIIWYRLNKFLFITIDPPLEAYAKTLNIILCNSLS